MRTYLFLIHQRSIWSLSSQPIEQITVKVNLYSSYTTSLNATEIHMPYGITQCYLQPDIGDIPASTPAKAGTRFSDSRGMQG